ncbi:MAG: TraR/DksA C4-type zinc finger protein [bacterium]|nr:TraR/DksA C4-type zinc finger protein [bacterium]
MNQELMKELGSLLEKEKKALTEELGTFAHPDKNVKGDWDANYENLGDGWDENAQEVTEYATRLPMEHNLETRLQDINDALEKIKNNAFGICEKCGEAIDVERLRAEPAARVCVQH